MRFIYTKAFTIIFLSIVALSLLIFLQIKGLLSPIRNVFLQAPRPFMYVIRSVSIPTKSFFSTIYDLQKITRENASLQRQVYGLQQDLVMYQQEKRENEALRNELGFFDAVKQSYQSCSVIAYNPLGLTDTLVLNCGSSKGITEGSAVVSQGYLVGKIIYAAKDSSTALLITNSKFSTDAKLSKTGAKAVVRGSFGSGILLDQVSQNDQVDKGAQVVTAGINEKIPKNILVGEIGETLSGQNDLFKKTTIISPVDFQNIQFVFVAK